MKKDSALQPVFSTYQKKSGGEEFRAAWLREEFLMEI